MKRKRHVNQYWFGKINLKQFHKLLSLLATMVLVVYGLFLLNHVFYSLWSSTAGISPNQYEAIWYQEALSSFTYAVLVFFLAFLTRVKWERIKSNRCIHASILIVVLFLAFPHVREYILIDSCLDSGGTWSYKYFQCSME